MNNSIFGALFDNRPVIAAAIFLTALTVFINVPAIAADKVTTESDKTKTNAVAAPAVDKAKTNAAAAPASGAVKPEKAKTVNKKGVPPAKDAGKNGDATAEDDDQADSVSARRAATKALREAAAEAKKQRDATDIEDLKKMGWISGPVKDKSELPPFKMVYIKGGCFEMGDWTGDGDDDEQPAHKVCVSNYYISETEVTQMLYEAVTGTIPSMYVGPDRPVTNIKPRNIRRFIKDLNKLTGRAYRLPTEAEWEYAARSGGKNERWAGTDNEDVLSDYAWFNENAEGGTRKVAQKKPNGLGLYDMTGNVMEWLEDYFDFEYYGRSPKRDPLNAEYTTWFVLRGGSFVDGPFTLRTTYRLGIEPMKTAFGANVGIRLAE